MTYRPKHVAEYALLRTTAGLAGILPYRAALAVAWFHALFFFRIFRSRVDEVKARIASVFGDRFSRSEITRIAWVSCRNTAFDAIEMVRFPRMTLEWFHTLSNCAEAMPVLEQHADTGEGAIVALPHMGNWEMAGVACHLHGIPIFNIAARQRNPLVNDYINHLRRRPGIDTLARGSDTMRQVLRRLRSGQMLAILPDVRMQEKALSVSFLGGTANLGKGMGLFARHTGVPIFPCIVTRRGWTRHEMLAHAPIRSEPGLSKEEDILRMTTHVMGIIDAAIREDPAQWFWFNKRWVLEPVADRA